MVVIPRQVEYAVMALSDMSAAQPGDVFAARALCETHGTPFDVMSRTLQRLHRAGMLRAVRGVSGGYQLNQRVDELSLLDLFDAVSGRLSAAHCTDGPGSACKCRMRAVCKVSGSMKTLDVRIRQLYRAVRLSDLFEAKAESAGKRSRKGAKRAKAEVFNAGGS